MKRSVTQRTKTFLTALLTGVSSLAMSQGTLGGDITNPITDSIVVKADGLELSVYSFLNADSVKWKVRNDISHDSTYYLYTGSQTATPIIVTENATVTAWVRSQGLWYQQLVQFNGVTQDPGSGTLQAPVIPNAVYTWYFEGDALPVSGASYTPTEIGTYTVVITWSTSAPNSNTRLEGENRAEFVFEVTQLGVTTSIDKNIAAISSVALYPNPASENVRITNVSGAFDFTIESLTAGEVAKGSALGNSDIDISHLKSGLYIVRIKTAESEVSKKLMVK